jgi:hypothetical protein
MKRHAIIEDSDSAYAKAKLSTHSADGPGQAFAWNESRRNVTVQMPRCGVGVPTIKRVSVSEALKPAQSASTKNFLLLTVILFLFVAVSDTKRIKYESD